MRILLLSFLSIFYLASNAQTKILLTQKNNISYSSERSTNQELNVAFSINQLSLQSIEHQGELFSEMNIEGFGKSYFEGEPNLPQLSKILMFPLGTKVKLGAINNDSEVVELSDYGISNDIVPSIASISKSQDASEVKYIRGENYSKNKFYKRSVVELQYLGTMRSAEMYQLVYNPIAYNAVKGIIEVRNNVTCSVKTVKGSVISNDWDFNMANTNLRKAHSKAFAPKDVAIAETYVIVSPAKYKTTLASFVKLKQQLGYHVIEAYIDEDIISNNKNDIKDYLEALYSNPPEGYEAFTNLLIIGDVDQIPSWAGTTDSHVTDLYYAEYTDDFLPEVLYGRMSVNSEEELQVIIDKNILVQLASGETTDFQNDHLLVAGVDAGYAPVYGNGAINYFMDYYSNEDIGVSTSYYLYGSGSPITSNSSQARQAILDDFSSGVGIAYYSAHCSSAGWSDPSFENTDISGLSNKDKYPLMIGNCCQSFTFNQNSFGENIIKAKDKGAVAYIGATNFSYWDEDYYWGIGNTSNIIANPTYEDTELGSWDAWFHTHDEDESDIISTAGQILWTGNMAVQASTSSRKGYYWEVYHVSGDPSLVPAKYQYETIQGEYASVLNIGQSQLNVKTDPYAMGVLFEANEQIAFGKADENGNLALSFNPLQNIGEKQLELTLSHSEKAVRIDSLKVIPSDGPFVALTDYLFTNTAGDTVSTVNYGESVFVSFKLENYGNASATDLNIMLESDVAWGQLILDNQDIADIDSGESVVLNRIIEVKANNDISNNALLEIMGSVNYSDDKTNEFLLSLTAKAPEIEFVSVSINDSVLGNNNGVIDTLEQVSAITLFENSSDVSVSNAILVVKSANENLLSVVSDTILVGLIDVGDNKELDIEMIGGANFFPGSTVDISYELLAGDDHQYAFGGSFALVLGVEPVIDMTDTVCEVVSARFYDSGGPDNNYSNSEDFTTVFTPHSENEGLYVKFNAFDVESSTDDCWDKLYVYNGANAEAPLVGVYCNNNKPTEIVSQNADGALAFKFTSDYGVVKPGWEAEIKSFTRYTVSFNVNNGIDPLSDVNANLNGQNALTNEDGLVSFDYVSSKTDKKYVLQREGYFLIEGFVGEIYSDTVIDIYMPILPDICFTVSEGTTSLVGAKVVFDDQELITDSAGQVTFEKQYAGIKPFKVSKDGYADTAGYVTVTDIEMCINIPLKKKPIPRFTFIVSDESGFASSAVVVFNQQEVTTNPLGEAIFNEVSPGVYGYTVSKDGYVMVEDEVEVSEENTTENVLLFLKTYAVSFNVFDGNEQVIEGAQIEVLDTILLTDNGGFAQVANRISQEDIPFKVMASGFVNYESTFDISGDDVFLDVVLERFTSILDSENTSLEVRPNPMHDKAIVNVSGKDKVNAVLVYDMAGVLLFKKDNSQMPLVLDVSTFANGVYVLVIDIEGRKVYKKIIVE